MGIRDLIGNKNRSLFNYFWYILLHFYRKRIKLAIQTFSNRCPYYSWKFENKLTFEREKKVFFLSIWSFANSFFISTLDYRKAINLQDSPKSHFFWPCLIQNPASLKWLGWLTKNVSWIFDLFCNFTLYFSYHI